MFRFRRFWKAIAIGGAIIGAAVGAVAAGVTATAVLTGAAVGAAISLGTAIAIDTIKTHQQAKKIEKLASQTTVKETKNIDVSQVPEKIRQMRVHTLQN